MYRSAKSKKIVRISASGAIALGVLATGIGVANASPSIPTSTVAHSLDRGHDHKFGTAGVITAVSTTSITVKDARTGSTTTFGIDSATTVRSAASPSAVATLAVGQMVAVVASPTSSTTAATIIVLPAGFLPGAGANREGGIVTATSATSITIRQPDGASTAYSINASTSVTEGQVMVSIGALAVGERVRITPASSDAATAASISIGLAHVTGTVVSVSGNTIVVSDDQGFYRTIQVGSATSYAKSGTTASLGDVTTGAVIFGEGLVDANHTTLDASTIGIGTPTGKGADGQNFGSRAFVSRGMGFDGQRMGMGMM